MGLTASLFIGRSALSSYQSALQVVGNNIANAATPGYSRLTPNLEGIPGLSANGAQVGNGVRLAGVSRSVSEALLSRLRSGTSDQSSASAERSGLTQLESILDPLGDQNLGALLSQFFNSAGELQNNPQNRAARGGLINAGVALTEKIRDQRQQLIDLRNQSDSEIEQIAADANDIGQKIAALNLQITSTEAGGAQAGALRDQRDQLLSRLSGYFQITTREQSNGSVSVYIGNESLVQNAQARGIKAVKEPNADGMNTTNIRFADDNGPVPALSGQVEGLILARDQRVGGTLDKLQNLASALIREVNKIHSSGQGLEGYTTTTGLGHVIDPSLALSTADNGLDFNPTSGSFFIDVKDTATGTSQRYQIRIDLDGIGADSSLNSVAADISGTTPVTATVTSDGKLRLTAPAGKTISFADDTSGFLAAVGINTFFTGTDSADIAVNDAIQANPNLVAASKTGLAGDGSNATALSKLQNLPVTLLGGSSLNEYYNAAVGDIAVTSSAAQAALDATSTIVDSLSAQRESLSGVNVDEEAVNLIKYQRGFEGAARYMTVVDSMLQTLLGLIS